MDTSDPEITFSQKGYCNHCTSTLERLKTFPHNLTTKQKKKEFKKLIQKIKYSGKGKKYDCVLGVSGGVDSSYLLHLLAEEQVRVLAVHLDNGWNSELAVQNIQQLLEKLQVPLHTTVLNWNEFKDLQLSFLKASTPDLEIPTDHAIVALMSKIASKYNCPYLIFGENIATESILPRLWATGHEDWKYISSIQRKFGKKKLKTFVHYTLFDYLYFVFIKKIKYVNLLDYIEYNKQQAKEPLQQKYNWRPYGAKHGESRYTRFIQEYILPKKFNIDKRKAHLSSLICSGQITRDEALQVLKQPLYQDKKELERDISFVCEKFGITKEEFENIMKLEVKTYDDYPSYETNPIIKLGKKIYRRINIHRVDGKK